MLFFRDEGVDSFPVDGVFTMDPAPFKLMIEAIVENTNPWHTESRNETTNSKDLSALKRVASQLIDVISNYGVSKKAIQLNFWKIIKNLLDSIELKTEKQTVNIQKESHSVEVRRNGSVIIASYVFSYAGEIEKNCCSNNHKGQLNIEVKIWKFPILADLKAEYKRIIERR